MPRVLFALSLLVAVILSGAVSHGGWPTRVDAVEAQQLLTPEHHDEHRHAGQLGHVMTAACALACVGTTAAVPWRPDLFEADYSTVQLWHFAPQAATGRVPAPDERPPIPV